MSGTLKNKMFIDRMFWRLFWPSLFSAIGLALGDIADALFVGIRIGRAGLATMSLVAPVYMVYNVLDIGIAVGTSVQYTHALGKGNEKEGIEIFSQMLLFALAVSALVGVTGLVAMPHILRLLGAGSPINPLWHYGKEYLQIMFMGAPLTFLYFLLYYCIRCDDDEKLASFGYVTGYLTDVAASALFILVFKLDVRGAILATVLGKAVGICIFMLHFFRKWSILRFRLVRPDGKVILGALKTGMSSSVGYIGQFAALLIVNNLLLNLGGNTALAEFNVVQNVSYLMLAIYSALGDTTQPLCGTYYAEHNKDAIERVMKLAIWIGVACGCAVATISAIFAPSICALFGLTGSAISGGAFAVRMFCLSVIPAGISLIWSACFQAVCQEKLVFLISQLRSFICFLIIALIFARIGSQWFWLTFVAAELLSIAIWAPLSRPKKQEFSGKVFSYLLDAASKDISELLNESLAFCEENEATPKQLYYVSLCVEEVCQAIIENAFRKSGEEYIYMTLCFEEDGTFVLHMRDNAVSFNPFSMKTGRDYDDPENLASLGIQMVRTKAKRFFYRRYIGFNTLTVEV